MESKKYLILKIIACLTMLIDHSVHFFQYNIDFSPNMFLILRAIGRMAFPLFCYLMVESFFYTKKKWKHCFNILLIAFISEVFFDIVYTHGEVINHAQQNVCFELFLGYLAIFLMNTKLNFGSILKNDKLKELGEISVKTLAISFMVLMAELLHFEYGITGMIFIILLSVAHNAKEKKCGKRTYNAEIIGNFYYTLAFGIFVALAFHPIYYMCYISLILVLLARSKIWKVKEVKKESKLLKLSLRYFYPIHLFLFIVIRIIIT